MLFGFLKPSGRSLPSPLEVNRPFEWPPLPRPLVDKRPFILPLPLPLPPMPSPFEDRRLFKLTPKLFCKPLVGGFAGGSGEILKEKGIFVKLKWL